MGAGNDQLPPGQTGVPGALDRADIDPKQSHYLTHTHTHTNFFAHQ
jgi:hypothetical protein